MRIRTKYASVDITVEFTAATLPSSPESSSTAGRIASTRWAKHPLRANGATAVALRQGATDILVGLSRAGRVEWVPVARVMNAQQLRKWVATGF